jgi:hypothetical protein
MAVLEPTEVDRHAADSALVAARDPIAESEAVERTSLIAALNRRCDNCGGPIARSYGVALRCDWCHQDYRLVDGQVQPMTEDSPKVRLSMRDFYALHAKR